MSGSALKDLSEIFDDLTEIATVSGTVMTTPSSITKEMVTKVVAEFPLAPVLKDLGLIVARELANYIEAMALRPADYADSPELTSKVSERLMQELGRDPDTFAEALASNLRIRG